jgi:hypothetical protein
MFYLYCLSINPTQGAERFPKRLQCSSCQWIILSTAQQNANASRLLPARGQRPCDCGSAEKRDELPSFHEASSTAETIPITFSTDQGGGNRRLATDQRPQSSSASRFTGNGNSSGSFAIFAAIPPRLPSSPAF